MIGQGKVVAAFRILGVARETLPSMSWQEWLGVELSPKNRHNALRRLALHQFLP